MEGGWLLRLIAEAAGAGAGKSADGDDAEEVGGGGCSLSSLRRVVASPGAEERDAIARMGGRGRAFRERSRSGTEG